MPIQSTARSKVAQMHVTERQNAEAERLTFITHLGPVGLVFYNLL